MKLVTTTDALEKRFGLKAAIRMIKEYGFDGYDCSLFESMKPQKPLGGYVAYPCEDDPIHISYAKEIRAYADKIGISCYQTHAPHPTFRENSTEEEDIALQKKAIDISAILGAEIIVIHPHCFKDIKYNFDNLYSILIPYAKERGIKIATENMFKRDPKTNEIFPATCGTPEEFKSYIDYANDESFTACLDIGHTELPNTRGAEAFIKELGHDRIKALHVHDNNKITDMHVFPLTESINFDTVCKALAEIDYSGNFTFEADSTNERFPDELLPYTYRLLEKTGRYLIAKIEAYKEAAKV
jgi:sugar phosphate isomerase/epimerase